MDHLEQIIAAAKAESVSDMADAFNQAMQAKVAAALEDARQAVAQGMFAGPSAPVNEDELDEGGIARGAAVGAAAGGAVGAAIGHAAGGTGGAVVGAAVGAVGGAIKGAVVGATMKGVHRAGVEHKEKVDAKKAAKSGMSN